MPSSAMRMLHIFILSLLAIARISHAASSDSFCKCTCGSNSTIIPLNRRPSTGDVSYSESVKWDTKTPGGDDDGSGITARSLKRHPSRRAFNRRGAGSAHAHVPQQRRQRDQPTESYPDGYHDPVNVETPYDADSTGDKSATGKESIYESGDREETEYESGSEEEKGGTLLGSSGGSSGAAYDGSQRQKGVGIGTSCADCNRQFCLANNLPICQDVNEDDVTAVCFQRDSTKDQLVVYGFMFLTVGLLVYAGVRPWIQSRADATMNRGSYVAVSSGQGNN